MKMSLNLRFSSEQQVNIGDYFAVLLFDFQWEINYFHHFTITFVSPFKTITKRKNLA